MSGYRYFVAHSGGLTYDALSSMNDAGDNILKALDVIDVYQKSWVPISVMYEGQIKGLSFCPKILLQTGKSLYQKDKIHLRLTQSFQKIAHDILKSEYVVVQDVPPVTINGKTIVTLEPEAMSAMVTISYNVKNIEFGLNIAKKMMEYAQEKNRPLVRGHERAVLTVNGHTFYPKARKVFSDWVVQMPPYIDIHGNDFVLPDCAQITEQQLIKMARPADFEDFGNSYEVARKRLSNFMKVEISSLVR